MLYRSVVRNVRWLCCAYKSKFHTSVCPVLCSSFDKDLPNPNLPTPVSKMYGPETDILMEQLKKCKSVDRILGLASNHLEVMNSKHIIICLENIYQFIKCDENLGHSLLEDMTFQSLCNRLMKVIRLFDASEVITTYKVLSALKIRNNTYVMQCVLKMIGAHLNNMSLGQLLFINFLLNKQRHNALVDGLKLAIPLVLQIQIDQQLDSDNMTVVTNCLQLACRSKLRPAIIQKMVDVVTEKISFLSSNDALTVITSLLNVDTPVDGYKELLHASFDTITKNINELPSRKLILLVRTCRSQRFYHRNFFLSTVNQIVLQKWDLESTYTVIHNLHLLDCCPSELTDYFAELLCSASNLYCDNDAYSPLTCIECLTATSYRPPCIDESARVIYSAEKKLENLMKKHPNLLVKFFSHLAMLGHFPPNWLSKILSEDFLYHAWSFSKKQGRSSEFEQNILSLHWGFEIYEETKSFSIPSSILNKIIQISHQKGLNAEYPLAKFLENGFGGSQFFESGIFTNNGILIDHIVVMRSGNYPVSLQNIKLKEKKENILSLTFVNDFILPQEAKIVAVIVTEEGQYLRDPEILKGWVDHKIRCIAKRNCIPVIINFVVWKNLPDREKIPYLMREIKQVIPDDCEVSSSYR